MPHTSFGLHFAQATGQTCAAPLPLRAVGTDARRQLRRSLLASRCCSAGGAASDASPSAAGLLSCAASPDGAAGKAAGAPGSNGRVQCAAKGEAGWHGDMRGADGDFEMAASEAGGPCRSEVSLMDCTGLNVLGRTLQGAPYTLDHIITHMQSHICGSQTSVVSR